ncbi:PREDICTED: stAR-related lipid transfer protein 13-like isoform X1 [Acropora digitifera]|uniref:stAR-related lipid transfer protein 13-like isoform X1 n=1 Tax=Acropora digitifera TaxID=70779 RepID=UPI00077A28BF|nr:PREDICTED: stAR-related lipid transfer protein 13-like isoform X1 [Acropora digitifera]
MTRNRTEQTINTGLKRRRHMGGTWLLMLDRMESSSCEEIPSSQNPRRSSPAENSNDRTITSKLNNGYCADENDNEALRSQVTEPEEDSTRRLELEALEACYWLKAAGFPQYAQAYEDGKFPIDTASVIKEHDFLDQDSIQSLYRRLQTLNRCAKMNLHIKSDGYDSDEEDLIALSSRWKLQNKNRRWPSRRNGPRGGLSSSQNGINSSLNSVTNGKQRSFRRDKPVTDPLAPFSHLDLCVASGRTSLYDNLSPNLSHSTPSISNVGKDFNKNNRPPCSTRTQKRNLIGSDLGLESCSGSSNDALSDLERDDEIGDLPADLSMLQSIRKSEKECNADMTPSSRAERPRVRWHSFERSVKPEVRVMSPKICDLTAGQLAVLRKYSLLKLTALMERHTHSHRGMWSWSFPHFLKKFKSPDYRDRNVFGVPLSIVLQRTGQPLPRSILFAINYLQRTGVDAVGIFRKSGGKQRINHLKEMIEGDPENTDFEGLSPYDMADMLKQYFRELPEPILTSKLAETFISIFSSIPSNSRMEAMQAAILLMPDPNREALQTLLLFLNEVAANSETNQMNEKNLGVCFAPSLFHLCGTKEDPSSPKRQKRTPMNKASKELTDNLAAHECLARMIMEVDKLFSIPEDTVKNSRFSYIEQGEPVSLEQLGKSKSCPESGYQSYIQSCIAGLFKEAKDKYKGWLSQPWYDNSVEISCKKVKDGYPLRLWRCTVEVNAKPEDVVRRILYERHLWDEDLESWDVIEKIDEHTDVFFYTTKSMILQPKRRHVVLRSWTDLDRAGGVCALVSTSINHSGAPPSSGVTAIVLASRYLVEPLDNGKSRLTHISRVDQRGRTPDYYSKAIGPFLASSVAKVRDTFQCGSDGLETNV